MQFAEINESFRDQRHDVLPEARKHRSGRRKRDLLFENDVYEGREARLAGPHGRRAVFLKHKREVSIVTGKEFRRGVKTLLGERSDH